MILCLLLGNIMLAGIASATPLYGGATIERILQQDLRSYGEINNTFPAKAELRYHFNSVVPEYILPTYHNTKNRRVSELIEAFNVPVLYSAARHTMRDWHIIPISGREDAPGFRSLDLVGANGYSQYIELRQGRMPLDELADGNIVEALATEATLIRHDVLLGELLAVQNTDDPDYQLYVRIVGIYGLAEGSEMYWAANNFNHTLSLLVSDELVTKHFVEDYRNAYRIMANWVIVYDHTALKARLADDYMESIGLLNSLYNTGHNIWGFDENFSATLMAHKDSSNRLNLILWVLQAPLYVLLAIYIYMVSRQILILEQNEISILKSRGASRFQLMKLYAMQGFFIVALSYPAGLVLGVAICKMLGASSGFMLLVQRASLTVEITPEALGYIAIALSLSFLTMWLPVLRYSRETIVSHKRRRSGKPLKALWQRLFLDFLCLGAAGYGYYSFNSNRDAMAANLTDNTAADPFLLICSSLFIIGLGLFFLRVFPYIIKLIYSIGHQIWKPAMYSSLLKVFRSLGEEQFIMLFLVFTLAVGIFAANAARTINVNNDHRIMYAAGSDLMFREFWRDNIPPRESVEMGGVDMPSQIVFIEPDFNRFTHFDEASAITRVQRQEVSLRGTGSTVRGVALMGVETDSFGEAIWYRDDLLPVHINNYLNVLASLADGVLLSDNFRSRLGYRLGQVVTYQNSYGMETRGVVMGFVEFWPGFSPVGRVRRATGEIVEEEKYLIVANLGHLQTVWGVMPYQVWMRVNTSSNAFFYEYQQLHGLDLVEFNDAKDLVVRSRSEPILQGINGVLTMNFIVNLVICFAGFLIYWLISIKSRALQFGIFRAIGMKIWDIVDILINEQLLITISAIMIGLAVGEISARLFVPLIQISFSAADQMIPLVVVSELRDYINLFAVTGIMIVICLVILFIQIYKVKMVQALKLGED